MPNEPHYPSEKTISPVPSRIVPAKLRIIPTVDREWFMMWFAKDQSVEDMQPFGVVRQIFN